MQSPTKNNDPGSQSHGYNTQPSPRKIMIKSFKTQGMLFGDLALVENDKELDPPVRTCFNCWSHDHIRKNCTLPKTYNYCCNCGRKGLTVEECPRCARAFYTLSNDKKNWIYSHFFNTDSNQAQTLPEKTSQDVKCKDGYFDKKRMMQEKDRQGEEYWDGYDETNNYQSVESHVENALSKSEMNVLKDENFIWEQSKYYHSFEKAYAEPHILFDYMQHKKIIYESEKEKIVNVNETRMAEMDSLDGNSILSIKDDKDFPKKDTRQLHLTNDPIRDLLHLLKAVQHLSVSTQDVIVVQYIDERKQILAARGLLTSQ